MPPVKGVLTEKTIFDILTFDSVPLFTEYFYAFTTIAFNFKLRNQATERLDAGYNLPGNNQDISALTQFRAALLKISNQISARNQAISSANIEPVYDILDPRNLPFDSEV